MENYNIEIERDAQLADNLMLDQFLRTENWLVYGRQYLDDKELSQALNERAGKCVLVSDGHLSEKVFIPKKVLNAVGGNEPGPNGVSEELMDLMSCLIFKQPLRIILHTPYDIHAVSDALDDIFIYDRNEVIEKSLELTNDFVNAYQVTDYLDRVLPKVA